MNPMLSTLIMDQSDKLKMMETNLIREQKLQAESLKGIEENKLHIEEQKALIASLQGLAG